MAGICLQLGPLSPKLLVCMAEKKTRRKKTASDEPVIPDKLYFRIGEVSTLCRLPAYVLRFWETEFPQLKPVKSSTGQRMYRQRDVENVLHIKKLLYDEGFTIAGARQQLKDEAKPAAKQSGLPFPKKSSKDGIKKVRQGLQEILGILSTKKSKS
jgi:DNA-binding transcriptional MerR regulator